MVLQLKSLFVSTQSEYHASPPANDLSEQSSHMVVLYTDGSQLMNTISVEVLLDEQEDNHKHEDIVFTGIDRNVFVIELEENLDGVDLIFGFDVNELDTRSFANYFAQGLFDTVGSTGFAYYMGFESADGVNSKVGSTIDFCLRSSEGIWIAK